MGKVAKIYKDSTTIYYQNKLSGEYRDQSKKTPQRPKCNRVQGVLSKKAKARLSNHLNKYITACTVVKKYRLLNKKHSKAYLTFFTLTLPSKQMHSDEYIKRHLLNRLIITLIRHYKIDGYVWKAELQRNGNIHFHFLTDKYIDHRELRREWNTILADHSYIDAYREKMQNLTFHQYCQLRKIKGEKSLQKAKQNYIQSKRENWNNPNTTDIKAIKNVKNVIAYICKYMTKSDKEAGRYIEGRLWGSSDNIKKMQVLEVTLDARLYLYIKEKKEKEQLHEYKGEYVEYYRFIDHKLEDYPPPIFQAFLEVCQLNYSYLLNLN